MLISRRKTAVNKTSRQKLRCVTMMVHKKLDISHQHSEETALSD